ncbi:hypothetical protein TVAG_233110 [Trichomonas vaginalis G3]|uniref:Uncharacterized protein n=1 Tax=Trichomonas vaginalis (strain ATCC PRA-98 / G3) TaxID=412133 RepID=A2ERY0_TRIV3|nr:armadillo (ARM) repeat-containing protein family [Trichomonas vaginalis G3]EAY04575.1 hypothetical protein TVAG_233110 [Trichomonas vaginalis G3]KAI5516074.1 armadillo (ARM) repeat-containing protein family [Trichomonas vaginalis G3]|eukprot:XP_001316798.1 hypothetical protein [Trichomonas vaginalis G3]
MNHAYGSAGWLPLYITETNSIYESITVSSDLPNATILGPNSNFTEIRLNGHPAKQFDVSSCTNYDFLGWVVGIINTVTVSRLIFYSLENLDTQKLSFLSNFDNYVPKTIYPFIFLPDINSDMILTNGYCILSTKFLSTYSDFNSFIPIPTTYHLVAAICYALTFNEYGRNIYFKPSLTWFYVGMMSFAASNNMIYILGSNEIDAYNYTLLRYLYRAGKIEKDYNEFKAFEWNIQSKHRIQALFIVNVIFTFIDESKYDSFIRSIPEYINYEILINYLAQVIENPADFIDFWLSPRILPVIRVNFDYEINKKFKSLGNANVMTFLLTKSDSIPIYASCTINFFCQTVGYIEDVILNLNGETKTSISFHKKRIRKVSSSSQPTPVDSILFALIESNPRIPVIFLHDFNPTFLVNIVKSYKSSVFSQHEALMSLNRFLLNCGEEGTEVLDYFKEILDDSSVFYSLKCHVLKILADICFQENFSRLQEVSRKIFVDFFLNKIAAPDSLSLQDVDSIHPSVVISVFDGLVRFGQVNGRFTSYDYLMNSVLQSSGTMLEPYFIQQLENVHLLNKKESKELSSFLLEIIKGTEDPMLQIIAINSCRRFCDKTKPDIKEELVNTFLGIIDNRSLHSSVRQAIARLIVSMQPELSAIAMLTVINGEFESENPDYLLIENVLSYLIYAIPSWGDFVKRATREHSNMSDIFEYIRIIMGFSMNAYTSIASKCEKLYNILFEKKWKITYIPDGLIKSTKIDYANDFDEGFFSDDNLD